LESLYSRDEFETCAIYGRRQVGKTTLMSRLSLDKRSIDFQFSKGIAYENLSHMGIEIGTFLGDDDPDVI
jgi:AAA+ ATPase superfamily predicted ATPase